MTKYKARLVAKVYNQRYGRAFVETFSPVVKKETIRALLKAAAYYDMKTNHLDIKTTLSYTGKLTEKIYMNQPEKFRIGNRVCKLQGFIYRLKKAARR